MTPPDPAFENLKTKLDGHYQWPASYPFKFIVKPEQVTEVQNLFPGDVFSTKMSANGKYTGMTLEKTMNSSEEVLEVYQKVKIVPGLMAL